MPFYLIVAELCFMYDMNVWPQMNNLDVHYTCYAELHDSVNIYLLIRFLKIWEFTFYYRYVATRVISRKRNTYTKLWSTILAIIILTAPALSLGPGNSIWYFYMQFIALLAKLNPFWYMTGSQ